MKEGARSTPGPTTFRREARWPTTLVHTALAQRHSPAARGAIASVVVMVLGTGLAYAIQILVSRTLGAAEFGTYAYVLGLLNVARIVVSVGFDIAAVRFASVYHRAGDGGRLRAFLWASRGTVGLLSLVGAALCALACLLLSDRLPSGLLAPLIAGCVLLAPASLLTLEVALLQALKRVYAARLPNVFLRPALLAAVLCAAVYGLGQSPTATLALHANVVGVLAALAINLLQTRAYSLAAGRARMVWEVREWSAFCAVNLGQSLVYLLLSQQADIVVVGSLVGTREAGYYAAASQVATLIMLGISAVNQFAAPMLAEFHDRRGDPRLRRILARTTLLNAALSLPMIVVVVALGPWLLGLFGPSFAAAYPVIVVLAVGNVVNALWGALWGDLLSMAGLQNEAAAVVVAVTILNVVLTLVLTPTLGILGAACATTAAVLVRGVLLAAIVRRHFGFLPWTILRHIGA